MGNKLNVMSRIRWEPEGDTANPSVTSLEVASLLHQNCQEEESIIEGEQLVVVNNCSACFPERRKEIPLTLADILLKDISARKAVTLLEDKKFRFTLHWLNVARRLDVNLEVSSRCERQVLVDNNYSTAMEECLDWWIHNDSNASWERLIHAVAFYESATGEKMRKSLGLYSKDMLKLNCDEEFIIKLSQKLQPRHFTILAPYLLSQAAERVINEQEPDEARKILRMLQHWKDCWKEKATYEVVVCVAKDALSSEPEIVKSAIKSLLDSTSACLEEAPIDYFMGEDEKLAHRKKFKEIELHFARVLREGAASIVHKTDIDFDKLKIFVVQLSRLQPVKAENTSQLIQFIAAPPLTSWFDFELFERVMFEYGDEEHKQKLNEYKGELRKFLNQSILNLPRNVLNGLQPEEIHTLSKTSVFIKIEDNESEMPKLYGSDVKHIKKRIAEHIGLSDSECIKFTAYRGGCLELVFSLVQTPDKPIPNTAWDEERQEYKITGDIFKLLPDSFHERNRYPAAKV